MLFNLLEPAPAANPMGIWTIVLYIVVIFGAMYFFMIRPQKKKQKQEEAMRSNIQIGDEIVTIGGIFGRVVAVKEDSFIIESGSDKVKIRISKWSIQQNFTEREPEPKEIVAKKKKDTKAKPEKDTNDKPEK